LAIGSRYIDGGEVVGWPFYRWLLSWAANVYCRLLLGLSTHDCTSGYRCYTRDLLQHIGLDEVLSQGYSFQIEMVYRACRKGYRVVETPIRFEDRVARRIEGFAWRGAESALDRGAPAPGAIAG